MPVKDIFNPRTYMQLANEEIKKSLNEPRADGKKSPTN